MFHILVVEDDAKLRSLFCTVLTNNGYLALPAESGEKALSLLYRKNCCVLPVQV